MLISSSRCGCRACMKCTMTEFTSFFQKHGLLSSWAASRMAEIAMGWKGDLEAEAGMTNTTCRLEMGCSDTRCAKTPFSYRAQEREAPSGMKGGLSAKSMNGCAMPSNTFAISLWRRKTRVCRAGCKCTPIDLLCPGFRLLLVSSLTMPNHLYALCK